VLTKNVVYRIIHCSRIRSFPPCLSPHTYSSYILDKANLKLRYYKAHIFFHRISLNIYIYNTEKFGSRVSSVDIATGNGLHYRSSIPVRSKSFSLFDSDQTGSGAYPASYQMGTGSSLPGVKRPGCEADHSFTSGAEVRSDGAIPPLLHVFMA
jgi:hypothetical protein